MQNLVIILAKKILRRFLTPLLGTVIWMFNKVHLSERQLLNCLTTDWLKPKWILPWDKYGTYFFTGLLHSCSKIIFKIQRIPHNCFVDLSLQVCFVCVCRSNKLEKSYKKYTISGCKATVCRSPVTHSLIMLECATTMTCEALYIAPLPSAVHRRPQFVEHGWPRDNVTFKSQK